jgi:hypothetical protein
MADRPEKPSDEDIRRARQAADGFMRIGWLASSGERSLARWALWLESELTARTAETEEQPVTITRYATTTTTEQPPAVASAGEVTDDNLEAMDCAFSTARAARKLARRHLYNAGRASRDAEVAELKREAGYATYERSLRIVAARERDTLRQELEAEKAAHEKDLRSFAVERASWDQQARKYLALHEETKANRDGWQAKAERYAEKLAEAQKARAVPTKRTVLSALKVAVDDWSLREGDTRELPEVYADAVLALFASPPASPDNTQPEPLPEVLPKGTRTHECDGLAVASEATLTMEWCNRPHYRAHIADNGLPFLFRAEDIDWAHWRSQQNQDNAPCKQCNRQSGCGCYEPANGIPVPSPDAGIEAVKAEVAALSRRVSELYEASVDALKDAENGLVGAIDAQGKRLDELDLQGRVVRRWMNASVPVQTYERIEREERERNK